MSEITQLRQKIKSIKTTKKITHAVRLVSMSSYSRLEKQNELLNVYQKSISNVFHELIACVPDWNNKILFPEDIFDSKPLIIVVSSAKGLCGSFNSNLFRFFERSFFLEEHQEPSFIAIGLKSIKFLQENGYKNIVRSFEELSSSNFTSVTEKIAEFILDSQNTYSSVRFYSNYLKNFFLQVPEKNTLIPLALPTDELKSFVDFDWEQNKEEVIQDVAIRYIKSSILNLLFQSLVSESASRFITMDKATTNAEEYLEDLTLQYNKTRQTLITREVSELTASL